MYSNGHVTLSLHKESFKGRVKDYVIRFYDEQYCPQAIANIAFSTVGDLIKDFHTRGVTVSGRLVACVQYVHIFNEDERTYYHPSYTSNIIGDVEDFFYTHMLKIGERMQDFNTYGSSLQIKSIKEIHLQITELGKVKH